MRRAIMIAGAGLGLGVGLAGCGSLSMPTMDFLKPTPPNITVRLESAPPGADARTSAGPGCRTPCAVSIPAADNFTVSFTLDKHQPQTVTVQTSQHPGDYGNPITIVTDPNPVFAELQPAVPPRKSAKGPAKKPAPRATAAPAQVESAFPPPPPIR